MNSEVRNKPGIRQHASAYGVLAVLILISLGTSVSFYRSAVGKDTVRFAGISNRLQSQMENKISLYVSLLTGVRGYISTTPDVTSVRFAEYIETLNLPTNYPGLTKVGVTQTVALSEVEDFSRLMAQAGNLGFRIFPEGQRAEFQPVVFESPVPGQRAKDIGFDMASDPVLREAMDKAVSSGSAAVSGSHTPQGQSEAQGELVTIVLPVYEGNGRFPSPELAGDVAGYVYASFRPTDFLTEIDRSEKDKSVAVLIYDKAEAGEHLLADTTGEPPDAAYAGNASYSSVSKINLAGREWVSRFNSLPGFDVHSTSGWTPLIFVAGICFSFLIFGFTFRDSIARSDLEELAARLTVSQKEKDALYAQEQRARLEAEEANRAKDGFLAVVSHELKTPLNAIGGWATILRACDVPETTRNTALAKIEKNLRLQARMIEQLLTYSELMAENTQFARVTASASEVFEHAVAAIEPAAEEKAIRVIRNNELASEQIRVDVEKVELALTNILYNALKFSPPSGTITAGVAVKDKWIRFTVEDNGPGIDPAFLPHIFEPYQQGDAPTVRSYGGLGLGLAIAKQVAELHGGRLTIENPSRGSGSIFTLDMPRHNNPKMYEKNTV